MTTVSTTARPQASRAKRLKAATKGPHEQLDASIEAAAAFATRARYGYFVQVQHRFHRDIDALYVDPRLGELLPGLAGSARLRLVEQDLDDLGIDPGPVLGDARFAPGAEVDLATALGWLYVAEGSRLGAAQLLKQATRLGLSEAFGARHLAGAPEGRGQHWRSFVTAFDAVALPAVQEACVVAAARASFGVVQDLVDRVLGRRLDAGVGATPG